MKILSIRRQFLETEAKKLGVNMIHFTFGRQGRYSPKRMKEFIQFVGDTKPHIFWFLKDQFIRPATLKRIKKVSPKTKLVMWFGDQRGYAIPPLVLERKNLIDALLLTNGDGKQRKMYTDAGVPQVFPFYHSFSTEEFQLWPIEPKHQVFFGGSNFKPTKFPLSQLRREFVVRVHRRFNTVVHGGGWPFSTNKWLLRPEYAKRLRTAHINLGINHYQIKQYYNRRLFESVASGRLHITLYVPGMEKHFTNQKHLVWFHDVPSGLKLINYYLKHPEKREAIAKTGRDFFIKNHSWPIRARQFVSIMKKIAG